MIIDGAKKAEQLSEQLKKDTKALSKKGIVPGVGILLVGDDPASHLYVAMKMRLARKLGFYCKRVVLVRQSSESNVIAALQKLQNDPRINGVIIQIPLPKDISLEHVCEKIDPKKDIDCLHPDNLKALSEGERPYFWPPTAESVSYLISSTKTSLKNKKVAVVGRGFFARQIMALCRAKGAHIIKTTRSADIVISAVGIPKTITGDSVRRGAIVIDVGTTKVNGKTVGDVDILTVTEKAKAVSPVPGGVGPVTVVMLMKNVLKAAKALTKTR